MYRVVVDDPELTRAWTYDVDAETNELACLLGARLAIVDDEFGGGSHAPTTREEREGLAALDGPRSPAAGVAQFALAAEL